jgi:hypothetical protein
VALTERRRILRQRGRRRTIAVVLILYGASGLLLIAVLALSLAQPIDQIGNLTASLETQRERLLASLERTSETVGGAAEAARSFDSSLTQGRDSATQAASLARDAAVTRDGLAEAMGVTIFGTQPLANLAGGFNRSAAQLRDLGADLDGVGLALGEGSVALTTTVDDLDRLEASVEELTASLDDTQALELDAGTIDALRAALVGLAVWLAGLALGCVMAGLALWRSADRIAEVAAGPPAARS